MSFHLNVKRFSLKQLALKLLHYTPRGQYVNKVKKKFKRKNQIFRLSQNFGRRDCQNNCLGS